MIHQVLVCLCVVVLSFDPQMHCYQSAAVAAWIVQVGRAVQGEEKVGLILQDYFLLIALAVAAPPLFDMNQALKPGLIVPSSDTAKAMVWSCFISCFCVF